jgi:hypothetical protein
MNALTFVDAMRDPRKATASACVIAVGFFSLGIVLASAPSHTCAANSSPWKFSQTL